MTRVAVIGAGPAGLIAARTLVDAGAAVSVFDKGRRPGGRLNTREHGSYQFDHGAQFFTVRDQRISPMLEDWVRLKVVALWEGRLIRLIRDTAELARPRLADCGPVPNPPGRCSLGAALGQALGFLRAAIPNGQRQSSLEQVVAHRLPHESGAEEGDGGC